MNTHKTVDEIIEHLFKDDAIRCRKFENKIKKALTTAITEAEERGYDRGREEAYGISLTPDLPGFEGTMEALEKL